MARRDGDTAVDGESGELSLLALGADYRGDRLRISADLGYQKHEVDAGQPNITIGAGVPVPSASPRSLRVAVVGRAHPGGRTTPSNLSDPVRLGFTPRR